MGADKRRSFCGMVFFNIASLWVVLPQLHFDVLFGRELLDLLELHLVASG